MAGTIAYDKPVADFIAGLDATGHVTHTQHRKTSVTFHHNGGRLSLQGILDVWKVREASAQFQVDGAGRVGQYVRVNEYAWATGNTKGNQESISIELANSTLAPDWLVAEATLNEGARLCGWLHARVLGVRPSRATVKVHHDWKQTLCAGPHVDKMLTKLIADAQWCYDIFMTVLSGSGPAPAPAPSGTPWGSGKPLDVVAAEVIRGEWGSGTDRQNRLRAALYDPDLVQRAVNAILTGQTLPAAPAPAPARKSVEQIADEVIAGHWGNGTDRQQRIVAAGYSYAEVRDAVNRKVGGGGNLPARLSINALAQQVIQNQWGKGLDRTRRLTSAGYDAAAVQAEVNRLLK